jgi:ATP synthase protein I
MREESEQKRLTLAWSAGATISSQVVGGLLLGYLLDRWLGTDPWLSVAGLVLGTISAFIGLYRLSVRIDKE